MLRPVRKFVQQCPLVAVGVVTLVGTATTAALAISINPPSHERERVSPRHRAVPEPTPPDPSDYWYEDEGIGQLVP